MLLCTSSSYAALQRIPEPPNINAVGYILIDMHSGHVIAKNNANERMEPASLTKMMTSYLIAKAIKEGKASITDKVKISKKAWKMKGSRMFIEAGKEIPLEKLLIGMIVQSGNDATIALVEHVAGDEESFVKMMNETAQKMGLGDTHFVNATGWPHEDHYSTPRDMTVLGMNLIRDFPNHYEYYSRKEFTYNKIFGLFSFLKKNKLDPELAKSMLEVLFDHPNMEFNSVLTSLNFRRQKKETLLAPVGFLIEKFREIKLSENDSKTRKWLMGQLRKQAIGNISLGKFSKLIDEEITKYNHNSVENYPD